MKKIEGKEKTELAIDIDNNVNYIIEQWLRI